MIITFKRTSMKLPGRTSISAFLYTFYFQPFEYMNTTFDANLYKIYQKTKSNAPTIIKIMTIQKKVIKNIFLNVI